MAKFDLSQIRNPSTNRHKIWKIWLCPRDDSLCKISCDSVHWGLLCESVKYNENFLIYIYIYIYTLYIYTFLLTDLQMRPPADFHARWFKRRGLKQGCAFVRVESSKLISNPWKIPQSRKVDPKTDLEIFGQKRSCMKKNSPRPYKRPLIVIVGP